MDFDETMTFVFKVLENRVTFFFFQMMQKLAISTLIDFFLTQSDDNNEKFVPRLNNVINQ